MARPREQPRQRRRPVRGARPGGHPGRRDPAPGPNIEAEAGDQRFRITADVAEVNTLATDLAATNKSIAVANLNGTDAGILLDKRDQLAMRLSELTGATATTRADGGFDYDPSTSAQFQALTNGQQAVDSFTYTVSDGNGGTATATVRVTVSGVNDAPTLAPIAGLTINEDAGQQTVGLTGISAGAGEAQALTVTVTSSNTALIPTPTVTYTSPNATGTLTFTPAADGNGTTGQLGWPR